MKKKVATTAAFVILSTAFATSASADTYIVQRGDTLSRIAIKYSTTVSELKRLNHLSSDIIQIQQKLLVSESNSQAPAPSPVTQTPTNVKTYTVVTGDTLSKIASRHSISLANLMKWNNLTGHMIYPGNVLKVSEPTVSPVPSPTTPVTPAPPTSPSQPSNPTSPNKTMVEYVVKSSDTLSLISKNYHTTVAALKTLNNLTTDIIYVGQKLRVTVELTVPNNEPINESTLLINTAKELIGTPYLWGGTTEAGFDCSGFVYYVYSKAGKSISRFSAAGYYDRSYYVDKPQPGDLIFFSNTYKKGISHMGLYLGNDQFIHADSSGVRITSVNDGYYKQHFEAYKRFY